MTRIGTFQHGQTVLADLIRNQDRVFQAQRQVASGRRADHFKDIPRQVPTLLSAKTVLQRSETYDVGGTVQRPLTMTLLKLGSMGDRWVSPEDRVGAR